MVKYFEGKDPYALEYAINDFLKKNKKLKVEQISYQVASKDFDVMFTALLLLRE